MIKLAGYLLLGLSIYRFYLDQELVSLGFIILGAFLSGGIKLNLDGLGFILIIVGIYFCVIGHYPVGIALIIAGLFMSKFSNHRGDWGDAFWDMDFGSSDGFGGDGGGDVGGGD